ncbi:28S ribosomal protein S10, mitochondrial [Nilaparvata lugens]|uniref:28S ribosomal protein S10, mitochondrial n=1 Tax=Nilaparvata lugens TaxID=108931 RepID=UPI000B98AD6A|nr:28S ribosomal protein S10, mitochondrial [Nilaparvata lugens]
MLKTLNLCKALYQSKIWNNAALQTQIVTLYRIEPFLGRSTLNTGSSCLARAAIHTSSCCSTISVQPSEENKNEETAEPDKLYKMVEIEVRGNDNAVLKSYTQFATSAAGHLGIEIGKCWAPEKSHKERYSLLKSIHVKKKYMVQYEYRTYYKFMQFLRMTGSTADTFLEYIQRNLPEGVAMKVTRVSLERIPEHLQQPTMLDSSSVGTPRAIEEKNN